MEDNIFQSKYLFSKNVRLQNGEVSSQLLDYNTIREAEIAYHNEVAYGLSLDNVLLAHYEVKNEYGVIYENLSKTIDNINMF